MEGIFAINKPKGPTSHDVIDQIRKVTGIQKVGHAGTLDPLASGVLVVAVGRDATKTLSSIVAKEKEYEATIQLGQTSSTDDSEGEKTEAINRNQIPSREEIYRISRKFVGKINQQPPVFSAIKVKGKPAHRLARAGKSPTLETRPVEIKDIVITKYQWPQLELRVTTGPGVYIRSLARDIGQELGIGGYLAGLIRTRVGEYRLDGSLAVEDLAKKFAKS